MADTEQDKVYAHVRRLSLSAELCIVKQERSKAIAELAKERKYSRLGGVIKLRTVSDLQDQVRSADDRETKAKEQLRLEYTTALPCKDKVVAPLVRCLVQAETSDDHNPDDDCADSAVRAVVDFAHEYLQSVRSDDD